MSFLMKLTLEQKKAFLLTHSNISCFCILVKSCVFSSLAPVQMFANENTFEVNLELP